MASEKASATSIDDPDAIETTVREASERNANALREYTLPMAVEPPTVFKP